MLENSLDPLAIQSYERKINQLQIQNINLNSDYESLLVKMNKLQDIQLKYQLLVNQTETENQHLKLQLTHLQQQLQQLEQTILSKDQQHLSITKKQTHAHKTELLSLRQKHQQQSQQQELKYNQLKSQYQTLLNKSSQNDLFSFKLKKYQKLNSQLEEQLETQKMLHQQTKQKELLQQKNAITKKLKSKYQTQIETYQLKIQQLNKKINQLELQNDILNQKNKNLQLSQQTSNIQKLKEILSQRKSIEKNQISKLQESLDRANTTLRKMVQQKYETQQKYAQKEEELKKNIKQLQNQLFQKEKSHTKQIFTLQQKMKAIKQQEINLLQQHIESMKNQFQNQKKIWNDLSETHNHQLHQLQQAKTRQWTEFEQEKARLKQKIKQLAKRLEDNEGNLIGQQTKQMIASFKDIDEKEDSQSKYQNGLIFLQRQLRKAHMMIDQKNQQISRLLKDQTNLRDQTEEQINEWRQRYIHEKKQLMDRVFQLQNQVRDLGDKLRLKEKQLQKSQKETSFEKIELQKRIQSLKDINAQLKKDYERMVVANKAIQAEYRGERDRGVSAIGDATYVKRMKWLELQKQKNQLSIVYRQKEQQLKMFYEKQIDQLRNQRDCLKQKATLLQDEKNNLKAQYENLIKKCDSNKENSKTVLSGKKKPGDMQKKLASLNLQIALTKNLFENLQRAKSRIKSRQQMTERIQSQRINSDNEQEEQV